MTIGNTEDTTSPPLVPTDASSPTLMPCGHNPDEDIPPLHLHVGEHAKLQGKSSSRSSSSSRSHSRSRDPSPATSRTPTGGRSRRNSNASTVSADEMHIDPDILTDKMGHEDLEQPKHVDVHSLRTSLPSVNERMSEETLEDCHAFTDLKDVIRQISKDNGGAFGSGNNSMISSRSSENSLSREGSMAGGSMLGDVGHLLETLEEFEEEDRSTDDEDNADEDKNKTEHAGNVHSAEKKKKLALLKKKKENSELAAGADEK